MLNDDLGGFEDSMVEDILEAETPPLPIEEKRVTINGDLSFKTSIGYIKHKIDGVEYSGVNQAQVSLDLKLDMKLSDEWKLKISSNMYYDSIYDVYNHNTYRSDVKDEYRQAIRIDDAYIQGSITSDIDLKIGRQIVVWGKSDTIRITDVISPLDNRLPAMTDIEDLRLSVGMLKLDYYVDEWNISAMIIPESRIMMEAPARSEFFPVDSVFSGTPDPFLNLRRPNSSLNEMQYALAINGTFSGWDLSFYASHILDQKWHFDKTQGTVPLNQIHRVVSKVDMLGSAINVAAGNWLFKSEAAYLSGVRYNTTSDDKDRLDILIGFDYMGFRDTVVSLEVANRHIFDYESQMKLSSDYVDKDEMQTAFRVSKSFLNETMELNALVSMFGSSFEYGGFSRVWFKYDIADSISTNIGVVDYIGGEKVYFESIKNNDRFFADITYSF
ncbi:DUF1302 domain-containing protein [Sulfurimonas sp.]|nr:DUF1302 domain-containing protein [Sulfurimonas sp.]